MGKSVSPCVEAGAADTEAPDANNAVVALLQVSSETEVVRCRLTLRSNRLELRA